MENVNEDKIKYARLLRMLCREQERLGITNSRMAECLGIKEPNYVRLVEGKCQMTVLRLITICSILGLDVTFCYYLNFDK